MSHDSPPVINLVPRVLEVINADLKTADFLWSCFYSAVQSYRRDTAARPFPQFFVDEYGDKDFEELTCIMNGLTSLKEVLEKPEVLHPKCLELLHWVLDTRHFSLKAHSSAKFAHIKTLTGQTVQTSVPNLVLEVLYDDILDARFESVRGDHKLIYAYHGSRFDNFHSILHCGLQNHLNKNSLFGKGTYLSTELNVCMNFSPTGEGWSHSVLGDRLSCVAVCEIVEHPDVRSHSRTQDPNKPNFLGRSSRVPEKYYIVQNDELIRVKYLLVYTERTRTVAVKSMSTLKAWVLRNRFSLVIAAYVIFLMFVGFVNSKSFQLYYRRFFS